MTHREMIDEVIRSAGVDCTTAQAGFWLNHRYKELCASARWLKGIVSVGVTVADQKAYDLPASISEVLEIRVNGANYNRIGQKRMWDLESGDRVLECGPPVYSPTFTAGGKQQVELYPPPDTSDLAIEAYATLIPDDLTNQAEPAIPRDLQRYIVYGALADGFGHMDNDITRAGYYEQQFTQAIDILRRRANSKIGSGPYRVQIRGLDFAWR